ncbi:hypothetical protein, partial [Streptomyces sp. SAJ15]|uniref:hypothetical protein n=1 Tax=Streptomyces sp. SAJ15 TaxID=2011095 RepID=UPI001C929F2C
VPGIGTGLVPDGVFSVFARLRGRVDGASEKFHEVFFAQVTGVGRKPWNPAQRTRPAPYCGALPIRP